MAWLNSTGPFPGLASATLPVGVLGPPTLNAPAPFTTVPLVCAADSTGPFPGLAFVILSNRTYHGYKRVK